MILVPTDTPGSPCRAPAQSSATPTGSATARSLHRRPGARANLLGAEGGGFAMAQARLGPGRMHHAMRAIGMAERALELMCRRADVPGRVRRAAGRPGRGPRAGSPESRIEIDQARLLVLKAAWLIDSHGTRPRGPRSPRSRWPPPPWPPRDRPGDRGARRRGRQQRLPAGPDVHQGARCGSPTARTRCTCARSPARNCAASGHSPAKDCALQLVRQGPFGQRPEDLHQE